MIHHASAFSPKTILSTGQWAALRYGRLVYLDIPKCASTFYKNMVFDRQWEKITVGEIDWDTDHVFSYIRDPVERHFSGIAEYVFTQSKLTTEQIETLIGTPGFTRIVGNGLAFDGHSYTLERVLGNYAERVDWIPIDVPEVNHLECTIKLLSSYGATYRYPTVAAANKSSGLKKNFITTIARESDLSLLDIELDYDKILYSHVLEYFTPSADEWNDVSWLKFFKELNEQK